MWAVGVDGCRGGWVAVALGPDGATRGAAAPGLREIAAAFPDAAGFGVDIPIGLPLDGARSADLLARERLGPRRAAVFLTPVRAALDAPTHREATAIATRRTGRGVSRQAYGLRRRIHKAEAWALDRSVPVWEVHPELSFAELLGGPASASKKTWAGMRERVGALERAGIAFDGLDEAGRRVAADDVLDAAAVAWSVARLLRGEGRSLPDPPPTDPVTGLAMAIWT